MACSSGTTIAAVPEDIIRAHILTRLHGPALASVATTSSQFYALSSDEHLWASVCRYTWPSTSSPLVARIISTFPHASRSFLSDSSTALLCNPQNVLAVPAGPAGSQGRGSDPRSMPKRRKRVRRAEAELDSDRSGGTARHELIEPEAGIGEASLAERRGSGSVRDGSGGRKRIGVGVGAVPVGGDVRGTEGGEMQVREVSMEVEDMEGMHLNGMDSLVSMQRTMEGKRGKKNVGEEAEEEARKKYREFMSKKEERKEKKVRAEGRLDMMCVALAAVSFATFFSMLVLW
ncbi:hypothetical protein K1719_041654 [Acacia pycnantha]|nr:hypothetical protein K1719_041654 [Acacia pycnantha]